MFGDLFKGCFGDLFGGGGFWGILLVILAWLCGCGSFGFPRLW